MFHISMLVVEALFGGAKTTKNGSTRMNFWAPMAACPPNWGVWRAADTALTSDYWAIAAPAKFSSPMPRRQVIL